MMTVGSKLKSLIFASKVLSSMTSSTSAVEKSEWLIHIPDLPDAKERRAAVFP
jgi:hypothetical protein